jgi:hypothetical protein
LLLAVLLEVAAPRSLARADAPAAPGANDNFQITRDNPSEPYFELTVHNQVYAFPRERKEAVLAEAALFQGSMRACRSQAYSTTTNDSGSLANFGAGAECAGAAVQALAADGATKLKAAFADIPPALRDELISHCTTSGSRRLSTFGSLDCSFGKLEEARRASAAIAAVPEDQIGNYSTTGAQDKFMNLAIDRCEGVADGPAFNHCLHEKLGQISAEIAQAHQNLGLARETMAAVDWDLDYCKGIFPGCRKTGGKLDCSKPYCKDEWGAPMTEFDFQSGSAYAHAAAGAEGTRAPPVRAKRAQSAKTLSAHQPKADPTPLPASTPLSPDPAQASGPAGGTPPLSQFGIGAGGGGGTDITSLRMRRPLQRPQSDLPTGGTPTRDQDPNQLPKIDPSYISSVPAEGIYHCPEFLRGYNCLNLGSGQEGDLLRLGKDADLQESWCYDRIVEHYQRSVTLGGMVPAAPAVGAAVAGAARAEAEHQANSAFPGSPRKACDYYFQKILGQSSTPRLDTPEGINMARVASESSPLHELLMSLADSVTTDVTRDLGVHSVEKQAKSILADMLLDNPGIATDDAAFESALGKLVGDGTTSDKSPTQCLARGERDSLRQSLRVLREKFRGDVDKLRPKLKAGETAEGKLHQNWIDGLRQSAHDEHSFDKGSYVLGMLYARLHCLVNTDVDLHFDGHQGSVNHEPTPVSDDVYRARLAWFAEKYKAYTGEDPSTQPKDGKVSCDTISRMRDRLAGLADQVRSNNPLLTYVSDKDFRVLEPKCANRKDAVVGADNGKYEGNANEFQQVYGDADLAGGFESDRGNWPRVNDCFRPATLSDDLVMRVHGFDPAVTAESAAGASLKAVKDKALENLNGICGPGNNDLAGEGKRVSCMQGMLTDYLGCTDIGTGTGTCQDRQSSGWVFCRTCADKNERERTKKLEEFYLTLGRVIVSTAAAMVPGGTFVSWMLNMGVAGGNFALDYRAKHAADDRATHAFTDFHQGNIQYGDFKGAMEAAQASGDNFWLWQGANLALAGIASASEARALLRGVSKTGAAGAGLAEDADAMRALERGFGSSGASAGRSLSTEEIYAHLGSMAGGGNELAAEYLTEVVRPGLARVYGESVYLVHDPKEILKLSKLEEELGGLERVDAAAAKKLRDETSQLMREGSSCAR